jgi:hypothetical protein
MTNHECQGNWQRFYRLLLSLLCWDQDAHDRICAEIDGCPVCWSEIAHYAAQQYAGDFSLAAGSLENAAQLIENELTRLIT